MNVTRAIIVAGAAVALLGCGPSPQEINQYRDEKCREFGAKPGTNEYIQCRATLEANAIRQKRQDDNDSANLAIAMSAVAVGMSAGSVGRR